jgi:hypothetical protein
MDRGGPVAGVMPGAQLDGVDLAGSGRAVDTGASLWPSASVAGFVSVCAAVRLRFWPSPAGWHHARDVLGVADAVGAPSFAVIG